MSQLLHLHLNIWISLYYARKLESQIAQISAKLKLTEVGTKRIPMNKARKLANKRSICRRMSHLCVIFLPKSTEE